MTTPFTETRSPARRWLRSAAAVLLGFITIVLLSVATDQLLHRIGVFPPADQPMGDASLFVLALAYRCVYAVVGGYITASTAPRAPMRHVLVLGIIGVVVSGIGAIVTVNRPELGPNWYPLSLVITALPCVWLGGLLYRARPAVG